MLNVRLPGIGQSKSLLKVLRREEGHGFCCPQVSQTLEAMVSELPRHVFGNPKLAPKNLVVH